MIHVPVEVEKNIKNVVEKNNIFYIEMRHAPNNYLDVWRIYSK